MATSAPMRAFTWGDGLQVAAQDIRLGQISALVSAAGGSGSSTLSVGSGVRHSNVSALATAVSSGLSVTVAAGFAIVQGSAAANSGAYACTLDTVATLTCATADPVNPRIDSVAVVVTDLGSSSSTAVVQIVTGTPAGSPTAPTLPANSLRLCNITVAANATSLTSGNLADQRPFYAGVGGITPMLSAQFYPAAAPSSAYGHDIALGRMRRWNGSTWSAPSTVFFPPVNNGPGSGTANSTTAVTVVSGSVTVDGNTPVRVKVTFGNITTSGTTSANGCTIQGARGATVLPGPVTQYPTGTNAPIGGMTLSWEDYTPPAGTYTYTVQIKNQGAGTYTMSNAYITVEAMPS